MTDQQLEKIFCAIREERRILMQEVKILHLLVGLVACEAGVKAERFAELHESATDRLGMWEAKRSIEKTLEDK